jgi:hypothetical protein
MGKILPPETARPKKSGQTWRGLAAGSQPGGVAGEGVFITVCSVMALPSEIVGQFSVFPRVDHIQAQIHKIPAVARDHAQAMLHCGCPQGTLDSRQWSPCSGPDSTPTVCNLGIHRQDGSGKKVVAGLRENHMTTLASRVLRRSSDKTLGSRR